MVKKGRLDVRRFIKKELRKKIVRDLKRKLILNEAELQSCVSKHLLRYLAKDKKWSVTNQRFVRDSRTHPDLGLYRRKRIRVAIELKERKKLGQKWFKKDAARLHALWRKSSYPVIGFIICLLREEKENEKDLEKKAKSWRTRSQRRHIFPIVINAPCHFTENNWVKFDEYWHENAKTDLR
jgi:hypothetical protein